MIRALISFELKRRLKMLSTWVYAVVLFTSGAFPMLAAAGVFKSISAATGSERIHANSPHSIFGSTNGMALLGLFTVAAIFGHAAYQDFGHGTWSIIFTKKVRKAPYLLGRFLGAYVFAAVLFLSINFGQLFGALVAQLLGSEHLGPHRLDAYLWPYVVSVWPMLFFTGVVFFSLAALTRAMAPVYVGVVVLVLGYLVLSMQLTDVSQQTMAGLLDPFGFLSFDLATRYWTPAERNRDLVPFTGILLANRALWTAVGAALLAFTTLRFRTTIDELKGRRRTDEEQAAPPGPIPVVNAHPSTLGWLKTAVSTAWLMFRDVLRSPVYWSFVVAGLSFVLLGMVLAKELFGTATLPVTWQVLEQAAGPFGLFFLITITFYAGELVWKDRDAGVSEIIDASRVPTWVMFCARVGALWLVAASLELVVGLAALTAQVSRGFTDIEWRLYLIELVPFGVLQDVLICSLAIAVQVLVNHKYLAHGAMVAYYVMQTALHFVGVEDRLVQYGAEPRIPYSDLNGYGHWLPAAFLFRGYWYAIAGVLLLVAGLLVARGKDVGPKQRLAVARARVSKGWIAAAAVLLAAAGALGSFLYSETHFRHRYQTDKDSERLQAAYEKQYRAGWADRPQPRIADADVAFDLFPYDNPPRLIARGTYTLENKSSEPIDEVMVNLPEDAKVKVLAVGGVTEPSTYDKTHDVRIFTLSAPLAPGARAPLEFDLEFTADPIVHKGRRTDIVGNGTFFNNFNLPIIGYVDDAELSEDGDRKSYGLKPKERMAPRDDPKELQHNYIRKDSDFIGFRATVSTVADQLAVAPGYLEKDWKEGDRRFFRYVMDQPILNFFSVLSARYEVRRDEWNGVKLEIYFHPTHTWNVDRMMLGMKDALEYCTANFGPYQHRQARILEFPRYHGFAQSFPNTIPYSEAIGFIARVRDDDPDDLDYPHFVTAHEIAHQWWAHQVVGANVRGATMTSESMAEYTALMVMKKRYGPEKMRRFLKYELDHYLTGRVLQERKKELPLAQNENQMYVHYQKGSLAMYALADVIGEDAVNRGLKKYVEAVRFKGPPYTTSAELVSYLRAETPQEYQGLIEDLFETITLYDNRTEEASMKQNAAGGWDVTVKVKAVKYRADEQGQQTEIDFEDPIDVGAIDDDGNALFLEKRKVKQGESEFSFTVPKKPARVGIDPLNKLIDRTSDDNTKPPSEGG